MTRKGEKRGSGSNDIELTLPQQQRSADSWERVLDAGAKILARDGYEGFTVAKVCHEANVTTGSIYGRVRSKEALFKVVSEREMTRMVAAFDSEAPSDSEQTMTEYIRHHLNRVIEPARTDSHMWRALVIKSSGDTDLYSLGFEATSVIRTHFLSRLLARRSEIPHADPERSVEICFKLLRSSVIHRLTVVPGHDEAETWDDLADELTQVFSAFLLNKPVQPET